MEFEVVFFYDLDEALQGDDRELMNRYLYVGISRVTGHWQLTSSHLAATLTSEKGNEDIPRIKGTGTLIHDFFSQRIEYRVRGIARLKTKNQLNARWTSRCGG